MRSQTPELPTPDEWLSWRVSVIDEIHVGKQSHVFDAVLDGRSTAIKLTELCLADRATLTSRLEAVEALSAAHRNVVAPIRIEGDLVQRVGDWLMTATPFVEGGQLDTNVPAGAELLGRTLAHLHHGLAGLRQYEIPPVAALGTSGVDVTRSGWQLLHGDFSDRNVITTPKALRIFDFDDCGYGPIEYDVANSLYMVLFDSDVTRRPRRYEAFRPAFLAGYSDGSDREVTDAVVDEMIELRIDALGRWLDDLPSAPIGIRTSSPAWLDTLATFVRSHGQTVAE